MEISCWYKRIYSLLTFFSHTHIYIYILIFIHIYIFAYAHAYYSYVFISIPSIPIFSIYVVSMMIFQEGLNVGSPLSPITRGIAYLGHPSVSRLWAHFWSKIKHCKVPWSEWCLFFGHWSFVPVGYYICWMSWREKIVGRHHSEENHVLSLRPLEE